MTDALYIGTDHLATLSNLTNGATDEVQNAATVTLTLLDDKGQAVAGADGLAMSYQTASNGNYRCVIPYSISVQKKEYTARVVAIASGFRLQKDYPVLVQAAAY
ncbi:MAG: hypothetical protein OEW37_07195 [Rhodospirillaceae bacterium]|nr:hypothetical protein [Rhodospirillaceae bacterium]